MRTIKTKKETSEDRFARHYYCNPKRFVHKMKKINRKKLRRKLKEIDENT